MILDMNIDTVLKNHGLDPHGAAQRFVDSSVIRLSDPIVPLRDGPLKNSANIHTDVGSGIVIYKTPYDRIQYYGNFKHSGGRSGKWFEVMKAAHMETIRAGLRAIL